MKIRYSIQSNYRRYFLLLSAISLILLMNQACQSKNEKKPDMKIPPKFAVNSEPKFKKDGVLSFVEKKTGLLKKEIDIEVADSEDKREKGLMYRKSMADNQGMLFIFDEQEMQSYWMKNTYIPLDIIFVNEESRIITIQKNTKPLSEESIPSFQPALYVVEVNAGFADKYRIHEGDIMKYKL